MKIRILRKVGFLVLSLVLMNTIASDAAKASPDFQQPVPPATESSIAIYHQPPPWESLGDDDFSAAVKRGSAIFRDTKVHANDFVGNGLSCANCHLNNGRQPFAAPLWGAWVSYPAFRRKNGHVNTIEERIQGCFTYSMDAKSSPVGHAPQSGSDTLTDLQTYMYWLAKGVPTGEKIPGRGFLKLDETDKGYDPERGAEVYKKNCAICHGENGEGKRIKGNYHFPPLWGPDSFNWGAGMHRVNTAAGFIKANMPLGKPNSLSDQEAWDVAAFVNSHERPQDTRFNGDLAVTSEKFHKHKCYYNKKVGDTIVGQGSDHMRTSSLAMDKQ